MFVALFSEVREVDIHIFGHRGEGIGYSSSWISSVCSVGFQV